MLAPEMTEVQFFSPTSGIVPDLHKDDLQHQDLQKAPGKNADQEILCNSLAKFLAKVKKRGG